MKRKWLTRALLGALALQACPAFADGVQMIPPTPLGSTNPCPSGTQQVLIYTGTSAGGTQGGINCIPIAADAQGNMVATGFVQLGNTGVPCNAARAGAIRFNSGSLTFEGCNGTNWNPLGGGGGKTLVAGGCQTGWSACPAGYTATSYFSPGTYNCCDRCGNPSWKYTVCSQ